MYEAPPTLLRAELIDTPGATKPLLAKRELALLNDAITSSLDVAPTGTTFDKQAGQDRALVQPLLPAATTTTTPAVLS